jgi:hypothetical protein
MSSSETTSRRQPQTWLAKGLAFVGGIYVLYHEIVIADTAEPLLVFLGLWAIGIPPATFFDGLRKMGQDAKGATVDALSGGAESTPQVTEPEEKKE